MAEKKDPLTFDKMFTALWSSFIPSHMSKIRNQFTDPNRKHSDQFNTAFSNLQLFKIITECSIPADVPSDKSAETSRAAREAGNRAYCAGHNLKAMSLYTESVATASTVGEELALAFANRSAVLMVMNRYEECLADIERALALDYPERLRNKLHERRDACEKRLKDTNKYNPRINKDGKTPAVKLSVPSASSTCVNVSPKHSPERGRHLVANVSINAGDVILIEHPYASALSPEHFRTNCFSCLRRCDNLIPCNQCIVAMFCSTECRDDSSSTYHTLECPALASLIALGMGANWMLALRIVLRAISDNSIGKLNDIILDLDSKPDVTVKDRANPYARLYRQSQHVDSRTTKNAYMLATIAACIVSGLARHTNLLTVGELGKVARHDVKSFVGGLLLRHLQAVECNHLAVVDLLLPTDSADAKFKVVPVGAGVYDVASCVNHSCDANVVLAFGEGNVITVRASQDMNAGDEICRDYEVNYGRFALTDRKMCLQRRFYFECRCVACREDWPCYAVLKNRQPNVMCLTCRQPLLGYNIEGDAVSIRCTFCETRTNVKQLKGRLAEAFDRFVAIKAELQAGSRRDLTRDVGDLITDLDILLQRPCQVLIDTQDLLRHAGMQIGNFYRV